MLDKKSKANLLIKLKDGEVKINLFKDLAPNHVQRIGQLAKEGRYNNVVFHRVIDGFMAQTGDVQYGNRSSNFDMNLAGTGGSALPNLGAEFNNMSFERGSLGMARSQDPHSVTLNFLLCFKKAVF